MAREKHKGPGRRRGSREAGPPTRSREASARGHSSPQSYWIYGIHAVRAALANPRRKVLRLLLTPRAAAQLAPLPTHLPAETAELETVAKLLPQGAVHQGAALLCEPLPPLSMEDLLDREPSSSALVAVLDQVTDPQNEGALLRSAAAFSLTAVIVPERHAPPESGALAKAASGALDQIPRVVVVNIARTLEDLGRSGFWRIALAADGETPIEEAAASGPQAIVLGTEGAGLRRLVRERCDVSAYIPLSGPMPSLNVSNAGAIAFYALRQAKR